MQGVYKLSFKDTNSVYIGKSTSISARFAKHLYLLVNNTHHNYKLQNYYNKSKELPTLSILEEVRDKDTLNDKEIYWIAFYKSFDTGFNLTDGGEGSSGEKHPLALYTNDTYKEILKLLSDGTLDAAEVSKALNVSYNVVSNILHGNSHKYLEVEEPVLYNMMVSQNRAKGGRPIYSKEAYVSALFMLANSDLPIDVIAKTLEINISILYDVSKGQSHTYLEPLYPEEYAKLMSKKNCFTRGRKIWPKVKSPEGIIHEVFNSSKFSKEHGLDSGGFSRLMNGKQKSQKGWTLCS